MILKNGGYILLFVTIFTATQASETAKQTQKFFEYGIESKYNHYDTLQAPGRLKEVLNYVTMKQTPPSIPLRVREILEVALRIIFKSPNYSIQEKKEILEALQNTWDMHGENVIAYEIKRKQEINGKDIPSGFAEQSFKAIDNLLQTIEKLIQITSENKFPQFGIETNVTKFGAKPLHLASAQGRFDLVEYLLQIGANPNIKDNKGNTPVHIAARINQLKILQRFVKNNGKLDQKNGNGNTAAHEAVLGNALQTLEYILANVRTIEDMQNDEGNTPLHLAVMQGNKELVKLLLDYQTKTDIKNNAGKTPLDIAQEIENKNIIKLLKPSIWQLFAI